MNKLFNKINLPGVGTCYVMGFIPCGDWQPNTHYAFSSLVRQGDASYICINPDGSSASPQDLFISYNNQILQLQNGSYVQASSDTHPDWQELCRDGVPGTAVDCATADANGLMSAEDYSSLRALLVSNESLLTQSEELQALYNQLLERVNNIPPAQPVYNGETEFRLGNPSSYASIGRVSANQSEGLIIYVPYASADKSGVLSVADYNAFTELKENTKGYVTSDWVYRVISNKVERSEIGNGALIFRVNGLDINPYYGGTFTANKADDTIINIEVPTAESIEESTLTKLGDKVVLKNGFTTELAKEMAEVLSGKNPDKGLVFNFTNPASPGKIECNPDILSVNYIKVGEYYRLNISGSFVLNGFNFNAQRGQNNYDPVLYSVNSGRINSGDISTKKTGMLYLRLSQEQASSDSAHGPVMFELSVFVEELSKEGYSNGIYGSLDITQFYS